MADEPDRENDRPQGSGTGGYGNDMNTQDQQSGSDETSERRQSRGERHDEAQGGGRGADTVSVDEDRDQAAGDEEVE